MANVSQVHSTDFDQGRFTGQPKIYVIASQPRSGSHYLAGLLRGTGRAGVPLEYFHKGHWKLWVKRCRRENPLSAFRILCQLRTTSNGMFGVKTHWRQFQYACTLRLENEFKGANFVQITRDDLLGQAISFVIASQTGAWIHDHQPCSEPQYSFPAIQRAIGAIISERGHWDRFFALTGINPLRITYENLTQQRDATMDLVCQRLGIEWTATEAAQLRVQRTDRSIEWRERFLGTLPQMHEPGAAWRGEFGLLPSTSLYE
ncbi:Stf0 family sulfotransferase [Thioalkalivibrio sp.]|uniref:Stf0 family sulfotransferase n=1 Tax=Thioalkalivibrio sp. TaxID=2093813 RepID=UPI0012D506B6|nr:Stf0 family sulfotransferase [Thioalkalivibrio sp.]TVP82132.1 MAG: hypothetical protein EA346_03400 [Thioalkalivibrio sp.]